MGNLNRPAVSIAIPTRNRQQYCKAAIANILSLGQQDIEVVIQDDSDDFELKDYVESLKDSRIKYFHTSSLLPSVINMDTAISRCSGEYVCMIGDDDGILPQFFEVLKFAQGKDLDSICPKRYVEYLWPISNERTGVVKIPPFSNEVKEVDTKFYVKQLFIGGCIDYASYGLPRVYHGLVKKEKLDAVKNKTGHYFGGLSPDIYSSVAISSVIETNVVIDIPFSIAGACPASSTALSSKHKHNGPLSEAPHLAKLPDYKWSDAIPDYYSVSTIWAESAMKAAQETDNESYKQFDVAKMLAYSLIDDRNIYTLIVNKVVSYCQKHSKSCFWLSLSIATNLINLCINKLLGRLSRGKDKATMINCCDIDTAVNLVLHD